MDCFNDIVLFPYELLSRSNRSKDFIYMELYIIHNEAIAIEYYSRNQKVDLP